MTHTEYRKTRSLIRANGFYALRWMTSDHASVWSTLRSIQSQDDMLALRARWLSNPDTTNANIVRLTSNL